MIVGLYARVSTKDKEQNPENQLIRLREYCRSRGWEYQEYIDFASGAKKDRPGLKLVMADLYKLDGILVLRLDRFGRSLQNLLESLNIIRSKGKFFEAIDQGLKISEKKDPMNDFMLAILGAAAEFERELISERVRDGMARARNENKRIGRPAGLEGGESVKDFQEFEDWMIEEMRFSSKTVHNTIRMLKHMGEGCDVDDRESMNAFIRKVWETKGNATANGYIKIANRYLKFLRKKELKYWKEYDSFVVKISSKDEKDKLLYAASKTGKREKAMFYLLFGTGVRLQEACDLKLADISHDRIRVRGKNQKVREIFLPDEVRSAIDDYMDVRGNSDREYLFTSQNGRITYEYVAPFAGAWIETEQDLELMLRPGFGPGSSA